MAVIISGVVPNSSAQKHGICAGDTLLSIDGHEINDILDFRFYETSPAVCLELLDGTGQRKKVTIKKRQYDSLGMEFDTYLMDKERRCRNRCIFCFIDQMPKGMRESLYFKDDDSRLSFLFGNYITLTNLQEKDIQRIIHMHISPVNISVHTTNPELRCKMMGNRFAGQSLRFLEELASNGIKINCQLVLCPHINDGEELKKTLRDLKLYYPSVESIAAVPVGLTKYRDGLPQLEPYHKQTAGEVIDIIEAFGEECKRELGRRIAFPADEFYLKAGRPLPDTDFYEDFMQLENGVGMVSLLREEFAKALEETEKELREERHIAIATGVAAAPLMEELCTMASGKFPSLHVTVYPISNDFFGEKINVAGLVTGRDLISQLRGKPLGETLLIPSAMLRSEGDLFLDNVSLEDAARELKIPILPSPNQGDTLLELLLEGGKD